ncbi:MAG: YraN family protein [Bacteroidales bacterium]|uniref:YraN family protein n=1 Tax=Porphyromonas sp. TaxID=1924944 RepID=UPI002970C21B|nr:YraN family protein [Porphyromonas sp.]MDD7437829.1 YraN family protein [Bacteroidales bacterium]MDY3066422.1 YraN family protein [Porphyromonas sp.]
MNQTPRRKTSERSDGHQIELFIADELRKRGFVVLEQNYRMGFLEVDLIALEGEVLCFIEVKARNRPFVLSELDLLIPSTKRQNMIEIADSYCKNLKGLRYSNVRYDYALVYVPDSIKPKQVQYIRNAFVPTVG